MDGRSPGTSRAHDESHEGANEGQGAQLTHLDEHGRARMVDVGDKPHTKRRAVASGIVEMLPETLEAISDGRVPKGDVFAAARIAGIMAAKRTADIIPMCHPVALTHASVELVPMPPSKAGDVASVAITAVCETSGPTGVEMEALTAVTAAGLTLYDMCKAIDRHMVVEGIKLLEKSGGAWGQWVREEES